MIKDRHADLSQLLPLLRGTGCVIDDANGLFLARLPTAEEKYRLMLHHAFEITNHTVFANGTENLSVKRRANEPVSVPLTNLHLVKRA